MQTLKISLLVFILSINMSGQWYQQNSGTTNSLFQIQFVNEQVGWSNTGPELYQTIDGGANWQPLYFNNYGIFQFLFFNENIGWALIATNPFPELFRSTDGGVTWIESYAASYDYIGDFKFINPDSGWFVGEQTISFYENGITEFPTIFKETTDGGMTWVDKNFTPNSPGGLKEIEAIDYLNLIVAGLDTLFKTTNGGINWQKYPLPQSGNYEIQFMNMNIGWASTGGKLFKTTDGGYNWYQQAYPITSFQFISAQLGWYTYSNQIYNSTNGGSSWTLQNSNNNNTLNDIFFIDTNNGWAVGQNGTILYTPNGGIPVELISFTATTSVSEVILNWSTATETNNSGFEILRFAQNDNNAWEKIGFIPGHGTTTEIQHYSFTDNAVKPGKYQYKLKQSNYNGTFEYSRMVEVEIPLVKEFSLSQNYPNPFNPNTVISYQLPLSSDVTLIIYDILGNVIATLVDEYKPAGTYEVEFNTSSINHTPSSGIYFYRIQAGSFVETKKMILLR